jgi:hypothetical protein
MYYTMNCKRFNQRFMVPGKSRSVFRIIGIATLQAVKIRSYLDDILRIVLCRICYSVWYMESSAVSEDVLRHSSKNCRYDSST